MDYDQTDVTELEQCLLLMFLSDVLCLIHVMSRGGWNFSRCDMVWFVALSRVLH